MPATPTSLDPEADSPTLPAVGREKRARLWLSVLAVASILLCLAVTALLFRNEYNPFWELTPEFREVHALVPIIHSRPLTDAEFGRALELCELGHIQARADAVSLVEESVKRDPARAEAAAPVMRRVARARNAKVRAAAERLLQRIEAAPAAAPK